jgi:hypothetical protein
VIDVSSRDFSPRDWKGGLQLRRYQMFQIIPQSRVGAAISAGLNRLRKNESEPTSPQGMHKVAGGNAPGKWSRSASDPERVESGLRNTNVVFVLQKQCDPCRVGNQSLTFRGRCPRLLYSALSGHAEPVSFSAACEAPPPRFAVRNTG